MNSNRRKDSNTFYQIREEFDTGMGGIIERAPTYRKESVERQLMSIQRDFNNDQISGEQAMDGLRGVADTVPHNSQRRGGFDATREFQSMNLNLEVKKEWRTRFNQGRLKDDPGGTDMLYHNQGMNSLFNQSEETRTATHADAAISRGNRNRGRK